MSAPATLALLQRTPTAIERTLPLLTRGQLTPWLPPATLALVDALLDGVDSPAPPGAQAEDGLAPVRPSWFARPTHAAWRRLGTAMRADLGRAPVAASGYRSPAYQALLILWLDDPARTETPARSEHCHPTHHAVDLTTPAINGGPPGAFAATDEYRWLTDHAGAFGFVQTYDAEPWHWRYAVT